MPILLYSTFKVANLCSLRSSISCKHLLRQKCLLCRPFKEKWNVNIIVTIMSFICALREKMNTFIKCISYTGSWSYNVKGLWCQGWPLECGDHCVPVLNREGTLSGWFDVVHPPYFIILFVTLPTKQVICFDEKKSQWLSCYVMWLSYWRTNLTKIVKKINFFYTVTCVIEDIYLYEW